MTGSEKSSSTANVSTPSPSASAARSSSVYSRVSESGRSGVGDEPSQGGTDPVVRDVRCRPVDASVEELEEPGRIRLQVTIEADRYSAVVGHGVHAITFELVGSRAELRHVLSEQLGSSPVVRDVAEVVKLLAEYGAAAHPVQLQSAKPVGALGVVIDAREPEVAERERDECASEDRSVVGISAAGCESDRTQAAVSARKRLGEQAIIPVAHLRPRRLRQPRLDNPKDSVGEVAVLLQIERHSRLEATRTPVSTAPAPGPVERRLNRQTDSDDHRLHLRPAPAGLERGERALASRREPQRGHRSDDAPTRRRAPPRRDAAARRRRYGRKRTANLAGGLLPHRYRG